VLWVGSPGFDSLQGQDIFHFFHSVKTDSLAHPACNPMDAGGSFPEVQQLNAKFTIHLHQVRVKSGEATCEGEGEGEGQFRLHITW
jgi:hypothetical protein